MFDQIGDMPLHPLVIHVPVLGIPLALLLTLLFAFPRTREWARWPLAIVAVGTFVSAVVAKESGEGLQRALGIAPSDEPVGPLIVQHSMLATQLVIILSVYGVLAVLNALVVTRPGRGDVVRVVDRILPILLVVVAVVVLVWVYRVGDIGSRAVWNPTGTQEY